MDNLVIQDVFEPYYAGRDGFAALSTRRKNADGNAAPVENPAPRETSDAKPAAKAGRAEKR